MSVCLSVYVTVEFAVSKHFLSRFFSSNFIDLIIPTNIVKVLIILYV